jgi:phenylpyruvate tautomerase PptA (4-oxalocrotonate tautomerase family)
MAGRMLHRRELTRPAKWISIMPLIRISLIKGKSPAYIRAIADSVHQGLIEAYNIPADDRFQIIQQHDRDELIYDADYLGIHRTDDIVIVTIIAGDWRDTIKKKALYKAITDNLGKSPGVRSENVMIVLSPNQRDEWSFGNGLASYVKEDAPA